MYLFQNANIVWKVVSKKINFMLHWNIIQYVTDKVNMVAVNNVHLCGIWSIYSCLIYVVHYRVGWCWLHFKCNILQWVDFWCKYNFKYFHFNTWKRLVNIPSSRYLSKVIYLFKIIPHFIQLSCRYFCYVVLNMTNSKSSQVDFKLLQLLNFLCSIGSICVLLYL